MSSLKFYNSPIWEFVAALDRGRQAYPPQEQENQDEEMGGGPYGEGPSGTTLVNEREQSPPPPFTHEAQDPSAPPGPPPPPAADAPLPPPPPPMGHTHGHGHGHWRGGHAGRPHHHQHERGHSPPHVHEQHGGRGGRGRGGFCGGRKGRGGPFGGFGGPFGGGRRGGPWEGAFGGPDGQFDMARMAEFFGSSLFGSGGPTQPNSSDEFTPEVDVFDAEGAFVVHASLPGAKKEDIAVNWIAESSELQVTGVVYRPGNEELLKTLALDERKVGAFERKVRLGSRTNPAHVDADMITAKLEDGILRITVPKEEKDFVEVKKVDVM